MILMQAKRQKRRATKPATVREREQSSTGRDFSINPPQQIAPVDRLYMRAVVGWQSPSAPTVPGRKAAKPQKGKHGEPGRDYLVGLTTFHIRPRWPR